MFSTFLIAFTKRSVLFKKDSTRLQIGVWIISYLFLLLYTMQKWDHPAFDFWAATIATSFYLMARYVNALWLIPVLYKKGKIILYSVSSLALIVVLVVVRMEIEYKVLLPMHSNFFGWSLAHFSFVTITNLLAFAFGALLSISKDYVLLLQKQEELKAASSFLNKDLL